MIKRLLSPKGKVGDLYINYVLWSGLSNLLISVENTLAIDSMLHTMNVSEDIKTTTNISYNYIGKDIIGQLGSVLIIDKISKTVDKDPKKFFKYNMGVQQCSIFIECITPIIGGNLFMYVAGLCNISKCVSMTGIGALNAKIINKLSIDKDNIGAIYSKLVIVNTLSSSLGMLLGLYIITIVPCHNTRLCFIPILGYLRYYTFNKSIKNIL